MEITRPRPCSYNTSNQGILFVLGNITSISSLAEVRTRAKRERGGA